MTEGPADRKHDERPNPFPDRGGENACPCGRVEHIKADHDHIPVIVLETALQHLMARILRELLGDSGCPDLALVFELSQGWCKDVCCLVVAVGTHSVQMVDIDVVGVEMSQTSLEPTSDLTRRVRMLRVG